jgi:hypothetical protein
MPKGFEPAVALVRIERDRLREPASDEDFWSLCNGTISVIRVYWSGDEADREAARLNELKCDKGSFYYTQHTRVKFRAPTCSSDH